MGANLIVGKVVGKIGLVRPNGNPSACTLTVISDTELQVDWTNGATNQDGTKIYYSLTELGTYTFGATIVGSGTSGTITGLTPNTLYYVKLAHYKGTKLSEYSNTDSKTTLLSIPTRNSDLVKFTSISTITQDMTTKTGGTTAGLSIFSRYKPERTIGNGTITQIQFHNYTITGLTSIIFHVWRLNLSNTYDRVYYEDILAKVTSGDEVKTVTLNSPVEIQEGDHIGFTYKTSSGTVFTRGLLTTYTNGLMTFSSALPDNPTDWLSKTAGNSLLVTHCYGQAPLIVYTGDSLCSGYPNHSSMIDLPRSEFGVSKSWQYKIYATNSKFVYQNVGVYGQHLVDSIEPRFATDVVAKKPRFVVIEGGTNDLNTGDTYAHYRTAVQSMLTQCSDNSIIPILLAIPPRTALSDANSRIRDTWNADIETVFNAYSRPDWIFINLDADMGQFRVGGDAGNLWDIKTEYDHDSTHFTEAGNAKLAEVILREIGKKYGL